MKELSMIWKAIRHELWFVLGSGLIITTWCIEKFTIYNLEESIQEYEERWQDYSLGKLKAYQTQAVYWQTLWNWNNFPDTNQFKNAMADAEFHFGQAINLNWLNNHNLNVDTTDLSYFDQYWKRQFLLEKYHLNGDSMHNYFVDTMLTLVDPQKMKSQDEPQLRAQKNSARRYRSHKIWTIISTLLYMLGSVFIATNQYKNYREKLLIKQ